MAARLQLGLQLDLSFYCHLQKANLSMQHGAVTPFQSRCTGKLRVQVGAARQAPVLLQTVRGRSQRFGVTPDAPALLSSRITRRAVGTGKSPSPPLLPLPLFRPLPLYNGSQFHFFEVGQCMGLGKAPARTPRGRELRGSLLKWAPSTPRHALLGRHGGCLGFPGRLLT